MTPEPDLKIAARFLTLLQRDDSSEVFRDYLSMCRRNSEAAILSSNMSDPLTVRFLQGQRQAFLDLEASEQNLTALLTPPEAQEN